MCKYPFLISALEKQNPNKAQLLRIVVGVRNETARLLERINRVEHYVCTPKSIKGSKPYPMPM